LRTYRYYQTAFATIPMPFAFLDLDLLEENAQQIRLQSNEKSIRIASKAIRCVSVLKRLLQFDELFSGIMCYSAPEALHLSHHGFDDLLIGYPVWDKKWLEALAYEVQNGRSLTLTVDSLALTEHLEQIAKQIGTVLPVCLEADMSSNLLGYHFGVWRSPIRSRENALTVLRKIGASDHLLLDGVIGFEAQIANGYDRYPRSFLKNQFIRVMKSYSMREIAERRAMLVRTVRDLGLTPRFVNGGGTGSLHLTSREEVITEVTVGSGFFAPGLLDYFADFRYRPAAGFALEIVRRPDSDLYTCSGNVLAAANNGIKVPAPLLPAGAKLLPGEASGEVQTPIRYRGLETLELGDPIFFRPAWSGELGERFSQLVCISRGQIVEVASTYRGDGL